MSESFASKARHVLFSSVVDAFENQAEREDVVIGAAKAYVAAHEKNSKNQAWGTKGKNEDALARSAAHLRLVEAVKELSAPDVDCPDVVTPYDPTEQDDLLARFMEELRKPTGDGGKKRERGTKPPWYEDDSHEGAFFRHIARWKSGEMMDSDSGAHHLVHASWRLLAVACIETGNVPWGISEELGPLEQS